MVTPFRGPLLHTGFPLSASNAASCADSPSEYHTTPFAIVGGTDGLFLPSSPNVCCHSND